MSNLKRYTYDFLVDCYGAPAPGHFLAPGGEWVRYQDAAAEIARLRERLVAALAREQPECDGTQQCQGCADCQKDYADRVKLREDRLRQGEGGAR